MKKDILGVFGKFRKVYVGLVISIRLFVVRIKQFISHCEKINGFSIGNFSKFFPEYYNLLKFGNNYR